MPLRIPTIDDWPYPELLRELRARIPVYAPEWTDFQGSDPGVAVLELYAYLADTLFHRPSRRVCALVAVGGVSLAAVACARRRGRHESPGRPPDHRTESP